MSFWDVASVRALTQANWERKCQLTATTCLAWEFIITWPEEYEYFWKKRWSFGKCLFLWSRYYSLIFNIGNAIVFMQEKPSPNVSGRFFHWQNTGAALQVITTHAILGLRLYAMYSSSKKILTLLGLLLCAEITCMGVIFGTPKEGEVGTNNPAPGVLICADGDPENMHWISYYWTATLSLEFILLSLSLYKSWLNYRTGAGGNLMKILTRDSVLYFFVIFWIYAGNQAIWLINDITLNELGTGFSFCISAILANRLMIAVRTNYYSPESTTFKEGYTGISLPDTNAWGFGAWSRSAGGTTAGLPTLDFRTDTQRPAASRGPSLMGPGAIGVVMPSPGLQSAKGVKTVGVTTTIRSEQDAHGGVLETMVTYNGPVKLDRDDYEMENFSERRGF